MRNAPRLTQTRSKQSGTLQWLPYITAIVVLSTVVPFAWSKGFDLFLSFYLLYLPTVAFACIAFCIWAIVERKSPRARSIFISLTLIPALIAGTFWVLPQLKDEIRFLVWSHIHGDVLRRFADKDAIIVEWEAWGIAGMENDSYLVSNPSDNLGEADTNSEWLGRVASSCEIVAAKRMAHGFYIVTTYNCSL